MAEIKTILWDVDGTLLDFEASEEVSMRQCLSKHGITINQEQMEWYKACNQSYWERLERQEIPKSQVYLGRFYDFFAFLDITSIDCEQFNDAYQKALGDNFVLQEHALALCTALTKRHRQYVVTNGSTVAQNGKLQGCGLLNLMDGIFISEEMGTEKPSRKFFDLCSEAIDDYDPETTMIIGDSLTSDMAGGNNAGVLCCWFNPKKLKAPSDLEIDYTIASLKELYSILNLY